MRPEEQRIGYGLAAAAVVLFVAIWTPWNGGDHMLGFVLASAFAAALALLTRKGHRLWTAFASFLVGVFGPWGFAYIFGAIYLAFGFWLGWRAHRTIKASLDTDADALMGRATPLPRQKSTSVATGRVTAKKAKRASPPKRS